MNVDMNKAKAYVDNAADSLTLALHYRVNQDKRAEFLDRAICDLRELAEVLGFDLVERVNPLIETIPNDTGLITIEIGHGGGGGANHA